MKKVWDFLVKHEFWFSCLVIIGLYIAEDQTDEMWMVNLASVVFLIAGTRKKCISKMELKGKSEE